MFKERAVGVSVFSSSSYMQCVNLCLCAAHGTRMLGQCVESCNTWKFGPHFVNAEGLEVTADVAFITQGHHQEKFYYEVSKWVSSYSWTQHSSLRSLR